MGDKLEATKSEIFGLVRIHETGLALSNTQNSRFGCARSPRPWRGCAKPKRGSSKNEPHPTFTSIFTSTRISTNPFNMLYLIGLGLSNEKDITIAGLEVVQKASRVYLEAYTSILMIEKDKLVSTSPFPSHP